MSTCRTIVDIIKSRLGDVLNLRNKTIQKEDGSYVSEGDLLVQSIVFDYVRTHMIEYELISEEMAPFGERDWDINGSYVVLDPIDGTRAFIAGLPMFGTLIGLGYQRRPILGVLDQPVMQDRFIGTPRGSSLNGKPIKTRKCSRLDQAIYALTDPRMMATPAQEVVFHRLMRETHLTQFGGNCYAYGMLASGAIDLITENDLKPWDIFALIPIIEGAGGVVTGWAGTPAEKSAAVVACGDSMLHKEVLPLLKNAA